MNIKVSTSILVIIVLLGGSANTVAYSQQIITPQQPMSDVVKPIQALNPNPNPNFNSNIQSASIDLNNLIGPGQNPESNFLINCPTGIAIYQRSLISNQIVPICVPSDMTNQLFNIDFNVKDDDDDNRRHHSNDNKHRPDRDCLFNASLEKCNPDKDGNCPKDFNLNEDGNCFPDHHETGCPSGTHGVDDDETGQCYPNKKGCPNGMELNDKGNNCGYKPEITEEQKQETIGQLQALQLQEQKQTNTNLGNPITLVDLTRDPINPVIPLIDVIPEDQEPITTTSDTTNGNNDNIEADTTATATTQTTTEQPNTLATLDNTATATEITIEQPTITETTEVDQPVETEEQPTTTETTEEHDAGEDIDDSDTDSDTDSDSGDSSGDSEGDGGNGEESEE